MAEKATESKRSYKSPIDVVLLDDDLDFRNYIDDFLAAEDNYTGRSFSHPEDLFQACEERLPDIVLLDMKMGEFRGDRVLEQLLLRWPKLCVIIVTGYPHPRGHARHLQDEGVRLSG